MENKSMVNNNNY